MKKLLILALKKRFGMEIDDAKALTKTVEDVFKGKKEIEDMSIDKYVRSLFYELQRERILKIRREEVKEKGKQLRKYYWSYDNEMIKREAYENIEDDPYKIYKKIPKDAWLSHIYAK